MSGMHLCNRLDGRVPGRGVPRAAATAVAPAAAGGALLVELAAADGGAAVQPHRIAVLAQRCQHARLSGRRQAAGHWVSACLGAEMVTTQLVAQTVFADASRAPA